MSIVSVGAGPDLGRAIAQRFGRERLAVGFIARSTDTLRGLTEEVRAEGLTASYAAADIRDADALRSAIRELADALGPVEVLGYSPLPAKEFMKPILQKSVDDVRGSLEFGVLGAVAAVTAVIDEMLERGSGTILSTTGGAAIHPNPLRAGVGISFAGEVAYARMLHDEVRDKGIYVAHTAIGGSIVPGEDHEPEDIAAILWRQHDERTAVQTLVGIES